MNAVIESWALLEGFLGLGEDGVPVGLDHARHPALGAVEHPAVRVRRVRHPPRPHAHDVAAGLGLGQPESGPLGPLGDALR